jgi:hypothetical protein
VIVVANGAEREATGVGDADCQLAQQAWPFRLVTTRLTTANIAAAKNAALELATGELIILLNDDVRPEPGFVQAHVAAHRELPQSSMVLGASPWATLTNPTLFDQLIGSTSMIFFYDQLQPHRFYNYRHAWNLNLSLPRELLRGERFDDGLGPFFYEDLELAWRLETRRGARVWYAPEAIAIHEHRYTCAGYFQRETELGRAAIRLWRRNPDCFRATYRSALDERLLDYYSRYLESEAGRHEETRVWFEQVVARPARSNEAGAGAEMEAVLLRALYLAHVPLKRLAFRQGVLEACRRSAQGDAASPTASDAPHARAACRDAIESATASPSTNAAPRGLGVPGAS